MEHAIRDLFWVGSSREDLASFPDEVQDVMGYALYLAQVGGKHPAAKPLQGFNGAGVPEVVDDHDGDTYRAVYTVLFPEGIYVPTLFRRSRSGTGRPPCTMYG